MAINTLSGGHYKVIFKKIGAKNVSPFISAQLEQTTNTFFAPIKVEGNCKRSIFKQSLSNLTSKKPRYYCLFIAPCAIAYK
jgi:hypothetical protein